MFRHRYDVFRVMPSLVWSVLIFPDQSSSSTCLLLVYLLSKNANGFSPAPPESKWASGLVLWSLNFVRFGHLGGRPRRVHGSDVLFLCSDKQNSSHKMKCIHGCEYKAVAHKSTPHFQICIGETFRRPCTVFLPVLIMQHRVGRRHKIPLKYIAICGLNMTERGINTSAAFCACV